MSAPRKYPAEVRERAVRLVMEAHEEEPGVSWNQLYARVGARLGVTRGTLRWWVERHQIDSGQRPGTTSDDAAKIKKLEREVRELKRANEILLAASSFFARELDPRLPW
jgi:transposase-like protein